jgi:hypothetical protein
MTRGEELDAKIVELEMLQREAEDQDDYDTNYAVREEVMIDKFLQDHMVESYVCACGRRVRVWDDGSLSHYDNGSMVDFNTHLTHEQAF